jgi:carboxymethylenebutenolidase
VCYNDGERPPAPPRVTGSARGADLTLNAADGNRFSAYLATPERPTGARIVLLPDTHGLVPFYKELAMMLAATGSVTLVIDYFGRTAGPDAHEADWAFDSHVSELRRDTLLLDVRAAAEHLDDGSGPLFLVGFCMGGGTALHAGTTTDIGLAGVVAFYPWIGELGKDPALPEDFVTGLRCPMLGMFGGADAVVPTAVPNALDEHLDRAGVSHEIVIYPGRPHGFFEMHHLGREGHGGAANDAWRRLLEFLERRSFDAGNSGSPPIEGSSIPD